MQSVAPTKPTEEPTINEIMSDALRRSSGSPWVKFMLASCGFDKSSTIDDLRRLRWQSWTDPSGKPSLIFIAPSHFGYGNVVRLDQLNSAMPLRPLLGKDGKTTVCVERLLVQAELRPQFMKTIVVLEPGTFRSENLHVLDLFLGKPEEPPTVIAPNHENRAALGRVSTVHDAQGLHFDRARIVSAHLLL